MSSSSTLVAHNSESDHLEQNAEFIKTPSPADRDWVDPIELEGRGERDDLVKGRRRMNLLGEKRVKRRWVR